MRTDGKQSKKKTIYYNAMERYYEKLGDRMHNLSGRSSLNSLDMCKLKRDSTQTDENRPSQEQTYKEKSLGNEQQRFQFLGVSSDANNYLDSIHCVGEKEQIGEKKRILKLKKYEMNGTRIN